MVGTALSNDRFNISGKQDLLGGPIIDSFLFLESEVYGLITRLLWSSLEKLISGSAFRRQMRFNGRCCKILIIKAFGSLCHKI